jgi:branched-chain amino acid transport system permease protein
MATTAAAEAVRAEATEAGQPLYPPVPRQVLVARAVVAAALLAIAVAAPFVFANSPNNTNKILSQVLYLGVAAMGLNLLTGFNGQVSIGHGAFFGVGAFTTAILMKDYGWPFEATILIAAVLTGVFGALVGFPALRVRGLYLALVTLGLAVLFPQVATKYVHGDANIALVQPKPTQFSSLVTFLDDTQWMYFECLIVLVIMFVLAWNITRGRPGRAMVAVRQQELAATTVGVNLAVTKVWTFALSAAYAGVAGALSVMVEGSANATNPALYFRLSIEFLVAIVIGGTATILGPLVGAFLVVVLQRNTEGLIEGKEVLSPAIFGGALILLVYVLPDGVVGGIRRLLGWLVQRQNRPTNEAATQAT